MYRIVFALPILLLFAIVCDAGVCQDAGKGKSKQQDSARQGKQRKGGQKGGGKRGGGRRGGGQRGGDDASLTVGEMAPDFTLKSLDGKSETKLASFKTKKPVVLFFGSYT